MSGYRKKRYVPKNNSKGGPSQTKTSPPPTLVSNSDKKEDLPVVEEPPMVIPDAPLLSSFDQDPLKNNRAHRLLDWSEGRGPNKAKAHPRSMHSGLTDTQLDNRGKRVTTSFLSDYDQDKALSMVMSVNGAGVFNQVGKGKSGGFGNVNSTVWDSKSDKPGGKSKSGHRTAPLTRVSERQHDGSYEHFNAKVTDTFSKFSKDGPNSSRVQTLYPSGYERLPAPDNPAQMPDHVSLDSITDTGKLRHVDPVVQEHFELGKVVEKAPEEDGLVEEVVGETENEEEQQVVVAPKNEDKAPAKKPQNRKRRRRRRKNKK